MRGETPEYSLFQYEQIPADAVPHLAFNVAGDRLLALLTDLRPILLNAATGELITTLLTDATAVSLSAAFSVDGTAIVTADRGGISVWSARDGSFDVDDGGVHTGRNYLATGTQSRPQNDRCGDACHGGA
jgi:hypothetical protein